MKLLLNSEKICIFAVSEKDTLQEYGGILRFFEKKKSKNII